MKKLLFGIMSVLVLLTVVSCSKENGQSSDVPEMLEVNLTVTPEPAKLNQPVKFEAKVTQGKEKVNDADEVIFEIWRAKDENHQKIAIKHAKNGVYSLEKSFGQEGTYYIISHVTARDMHNMPKKEFVVGTPSEPEDSSSKGSMEGMDMKDHNEGH
ncbi:FixH family protein [Neobacillus pocheonensis]|uniref:FixH family protein n=1 Tax=Neobacillus pocheonensis TaxID=363869 RepID=UPI003D27154A